MDRILYENKNIKVLVEPFEIPWLKIFTIEPYTELSDTPKEIRYEIYEMVNFIEMELREYCNPDKINIASFGNYVPHVHIHVQARYKNDSFFPEPTWGEKQRDFEGVDSEPFFKFIEEKLSRYDG